jgi:transcriptional regulator with XRE-family HTH domain
MSGTIPQASGDGGVVLVAALKTARYALGWSQQDLAAASGLSKVTIARMEAGMMSPRLSTLSALQLAMERAGASFALNEPSGGFTLRVDPKALATGSTAKEKAKPAPTTIEELVQELGGRVVVRNAGRSRDRFKGRVTRTEISEDTAPGEGLSDFPHAGLAPREGVEANAEGSAP